MAKQPTPIERQKEAQRKTGYGAIWLRRVGNFAVVEIEKDGEWIEVMREHVDGNFSHIIEPLGIEACMCCLPSVAGGVSNG